MSSGAASPAFPVSPAGRAASPSLVSSSAGGSSFAEDSSVASSDFGFDSFLDVTEDTPEESIVFPGLCFTFDSQSRCQNIEQLRQAMVATGLDALLSILDESVRREMLESGKLFEQMIVDEETLELLARIGQRFRHGKSSSSSKNKSGKRHRKSKGSMSGMTETMTDTSMISAGKDHIAKLPFAKHPRQQEPLYEAFYAVYLACDRGKSLGNPSKVNAVISQICAERVEKYETSSFIPPLFSALRCISNLEPFQPDQHWSLSFFDESSHFIPREGASIADFRRCLKIMGFSPNQNSLTAFDFAIRSGQAEYTRACLEHRKKEETDMNSAEQEELVTRSLKWVEFNKSFVFDYILTLDHGRQCLDTLREGLLTWIKAGRPVSSLDLFGVVWHDHESTQHLWNALKERFETILQYRTLHDSKLDWSWFRNEWMNHPLFIAEPKKLEHLEQILQVQDSSVKGQEIQAGFTRLIESDYSSWNALCEFDLHNNNNNDDEREELGNHNNSGLSLSLFESAEHALMDSVKEEFKYNHSHLLLRQDMIKYGVQSTKSEMELNEINIQSSSFDYDAEQEYEMAYITEVVTVAHLLNPSFEATIKPILSRFGEVRIGPVKSSERIRHKTLNDYTDRSMGYSFPRSSHVVDLIRCSVTIDSLEGMYGACRKFIRECQKSRNKSVSLTMLRCKNGFNRYASEKLNNESVDDEKIAMMMEEEGVMEEPSLDMSKVSVPKQYVDVKFNVVITDNIRKLAVIGEVQLLLDVILASKVKGHEMYEAIRNVPFLRRCQMQYTNENLGEWLLRGGSNPKWLTPLLIDFPHKFSVKQLSMCVSDSTGLTPFTLLAKNASLLSGQILSRLLFLINLNSTVDEINLVFDQGGPSNEWWLPLVANKVHRTWIEELRFFELTDRSLTSSSSIDTTDMKSERDSDIGTDGSSVSHRSKKGAFVSASTQFYRRLLMLAAYIEMNSTLKFRDLCVLMPMLSVNPPMIGECDEKALQREFDFAVRLWTKPGIAKIAQVKTKDLDDRSELLKKFRFKGKDRCLIELIYYSMDPDELDDREKDEVTGAPKPLNPNREEFVQISEAVLSRQLPLFSMNERLMCVCMSLFLINSIQSVNSARVSRDSSKKPIVISSLRMSRIMRAFVYNERMIELLHEMDNGKYFRCRHTGLTKYSMRLHMILRYLHTRRIHNREDPTDHAAVIQTMIPRSFDNAESENKFWMSTVPFEFRQGCLFEQMIQKCQYRTQKADEMFGHILPSELWKEYQEYKAAEVEELKTATVDSRSPRSHRTTKTVIDSVVSNKDLSKLMKKTKKGKFFSFGTKKGGKGKKSGSQKRRREKDKGSRDGGGSKKKRKKKLQLSSSVSTSRSRSRSGGRRKSDFQRQKNGRKSAMTTKQRVSSVDITVTERKKRDAEITSEGLDGPSGMKRGYTDSELVTGLSKKTVIEDEQDAVKGPDSMGMKGEDNEDESEELREDLGDLDVNVTEKGPSPSEDALMATNGGDAKTTKLSLSHSTSITVDDHVIGEDGEKGSAGITAKDGTAEGSPMVVDSSLLSPHSLMQDKDDENDEKYGDKENPVTPTITDDVEFMDSSSDDSNSDLEEVNNNDDDEDDDDDDDDEKQSVAFSKRLVTPDLIAGEAIEISMLPELSSKWKFSIVGSTSMVFTERWLRIRPGGPLEIYSDAAMRNLSGQIPIENVTSVSLMTDSDRKFQLNLLRKTKLRSRTTVRSARTKKTGGSKRAEEAEKGRVVVRAQAWIVKLESPELKDYWVEGLTLHLDYVRQRMDEKEWQSRL